MKGLSLKSILINYKETLCEKIFHYELNGKSIINLRFYIENFCHLAGLHYIYDNDKRYLGAKGYKNIINESITIDSIKKHNEKSFNFIKSKLENFGNIFELLSKGKMTGFDVKRMTDYTEIVANLVIYHNEKELLLHLFLRKERDDSNEYTPVSFIIESGTEKKDSRYIARQKYITITNFEIIEKPKQSDSNH